MFPEGSQLEILLKPRNIVTVRFAARRARSAPLTPTLSKVSVRVEQSEWSLRKSRSSYLAILKLPEPTFCASESGLHRSIFAGVQSRIADSCRHKALMFNP